MVDIKRHADLDVIDNFCFLFFWRVFFYLFIYCLLACLLYFVLFVWFLNFVYFFVLDSQLGRIKPSQLPSCCLLGFAHNRRHHIVRLILHILFPPPIEYLLLCWFVSAGFSQELRNTTQREMLKNLHATARSYTKDNSTIDGWIRRAVRYSFSFG